MLPIPGDFEMHRTNIVFHIEKNDCIAAYPPHALFQMQGNLRVISTE